MRDATSCNAVIVWRSRLSTMSPPHPQPEPGDEAGGPIGKTPRHAGIQTVAADRMPKIKAVVHRRGRAERSN